MATPVAKHVIASTNLFLGTSNFVVLAMPPEYSIGQTINPNEVNATHLARGAAWVVDGRCSHFVRGSGPSLELLLLAERGANRPRWASSGRALALGGHEGVLVLDALRVGFPRRREHVRLRAWWPCERTRRSLILEIMGPAPLSLEPFAEAIAASECH